MTSRTKYCSIGVCLAACGLMIAIGIGAVLQLRVAPRVVRPVYDPLTDARLAIENGESSDSIMRILESSDLVGVETMSSDGLHLVEIALYRSRIDVAQKLPDEYGTDYMSQEKITDLDNYMNRKYGYSIFVE